MSLYAKIDAGVGVEEPEDTSSMEDDESKDHSFDSNE